MVVIPIFNSPLAEIETLPEYITKYHDQRQQLIDQMNSKIKIASENVG